MGELEVMYIEQQIFIEKYPLKLDRVILLGFQFRLNKLIIEYESVYFYLKETCN